MLISWAADLEFVVWFPIFRRLERGIETMTCRYAADWRWTGNDIQNIEGIAWVVVLLLYFEWALSKLNYWRHCLSCDTFAVFRVSFEWIELLKALLELWHFCCISSELWVNWVTEGIAWVVTLLVLVFFEWALSKLNYRRHCLSCGILLYSELALSELNY